MWEGGGLARQEKFIVSTVTKRNVLISLVIQCSEKVRDMKERRSCNA